MSDADRGDRPPDAGLFGQLPRSRPGVRSPRRKKADETPTEAHEPMPAPAPEEMGAREAPPPPSSHEVPAHEGRPEPPPGPGAEPPAGGLEDLAWAGIAVTAEAATLGVRLLGRAIDAARKATDRG